MSSSFFLDLPTELRLRIAEFAFEQHPAVGIPPTRLPLPVRDDYRPSKNLALLLVCRRFNSDFAQLAFKKTRISIWTKKERDNLLLLPSHKLGSIRTIVDRAPSSVITAWGSYCYCLQQLNLDELVVLCNKFFFISNRDAIDAAALLRRLSNVKIVKFVMYDDWMGTKRSHYCRLIGAIMKEDHFQRYDAPGAPNIEARSWDWDLSPLADTITFTAQSPRPHIPEEEYMLLMKPKIDAMIAEAEYAGGL